ncbi:hypothetical protein LWI29_024103 [Acer saccharum]|uniref:Putative plant transposon protein domain-containing protein n=1 Tax=Acer saccharum TaxID=4024 RepID=A0AA39SX08_ACESA|nr:hypothetical protein LWI29_024103 [Acer saccharum]
MYNQTLANAIRGEWHLTWNTSNPFVQAHLDFQSAFWHTFFSYSLFSSHHRHTITFGPVVLIYLMKMELPFEVGTVAIKRITEAGRTNVPSMSFSCLITHFCERAGVRFDLEDEWRDGRVVGTKAYNKAAIPKGFPKLESEKSKKRRLQREKREAKKAAAAAAYIGTGGEPSASKDVPSPKRATQPRGSSEQIPDWGDSFSSDATYTRRAPYHPRKRTRGEGPSASAADLGGDPDAKYDTEPENYTPPPAYEPGPSSGPYPFDPTAKFQTMSPYSPTALIPYPTPLSVAKPTRDQSDTYATDS